MRDSDKLTYCYSFDEERYTGSFDSVEDALEEATSEADGYHTIAYIGVAHLIELKSLMPKAHHIIEGAQERAYDAVGEIAETYLEGHTKTPEKLKAIDAEIPEVLFDLFKKHGIDLTPHFWSVDQVKEFQLEVNPETAA